MKALESDEIFVKFITGWDDAFVVEDADHLLKPERMGMKRFIAFYQLQMGLCDRRAEKLYFQQTCPTSATWTTRSFDREDASLGSASAS